MIGKKINQLATELAPASTDLTIIGNPTTGVSKKITLAQLGAIFSGAVSFYTNYASFPATGTLDVIFCAKDTKKLYLWSGSAYVEVFPSQALLDTYQLRSEKGNANGYASLDSSGKVPVSQLPSSIMEYKGTWSAATNTPTLANGTGDTGDVYICNAAGSVNFGAGAITFAVGDYVIYSGSIWQRSSGAVGTVTSVAASITGNAIGITGSPVTTSGTLALAFAGTSAQYVNGAGNLTTFPSIISQAQNIVSEVYNNTGATLTKGTIVYINGGQGNLPTVTKALATGDSTSAQTYGIVQADITNMNNGYVVVAGRLIDLDTQAYSNGTQLYLSGTTAGTWTSTKPYAPIHLVYVGIVVRSHPTQGVVEVKIQNGYEMDELHNVSAQNPNNGDILQYVSSTSLWTKVAGTTSNIAEGSNLYYTDARSRAALSFTAGSGAYNSTTGVITIPTNTNQLTNGAAYITLASLSAGAGISYNNTTGVIASTITQYTDAMARASISGGTGISYNSTTGVITNTITQYTDAMARASISLTTTGTSGAATYNSTTGVLNIPNYAPDLSGYVPTSRTLTINGTAYDLSANRSWSVGTVTSVGLSSATSGVTIGSTPVTTSGTITLSIATASGSQQGLLSSTDWTTFNNKQNALTNPVTGTGTTNYLPKFTGTSTIGNSLVYDNGTFVGINTTTNGGILSINGTDPLIGFQNAGSTKWQVGLENTASDRFVWYNNAGASYRMILTSSGNLGLGVTPSAWNSGYKAIQNNSTSWFSTISRDANFGTNVFVNSGGNYAYIETAVASLYTQFNGVHIWQTAPSGTAGNAISFTQAMTLNASGNLSIGNTNDTYKLDVSGTGRFTGRVQADGYATLPSTGSLISIGFSGGTGYLQSWSSNTLAPISIDGSTFAVRVNGFATTALSINGAGAATFSNTVRVEGSYLQIANATNPSLYINNTSVQWQTYVKSNNNYAISDAVRDVLTLGYNGSASYFNGCNVGIGSTSPNGKMTVVGNTVDIRNGAGGYGTGYALEFSTNANIPRIDFIDNGVYTGNIKSVSGEFTIQNSSNNALIFGTNGAERMRITSGGNILLGTSSDDNLGLHRIQVNGYARAVQWRSYINGDDTIYGGGFYQQSASGTVYAIATLMGAAGQMRFWTYNATNGFRNVMTISNDGNLTIATGAIKTGNPGLGSAGAIKLGQRFTGTAIGVGGYIPIDIDGTTYYINLATTTP